MFFVNCFLRDKTKYEFLLIGLVHQRHLGIPSRTYGMQQSRLASHLYLECYFHLYSKVSQRIFFNFINV